MLRKGDVFASSVELGASDTAENWQEVDGQEYVDFQAAQEAALDRDDVDVVLDAWEGSL